jgi:hypothetical protein
VLRPQSARPELVLPTLPADVPADRMEDFAELTRKVLSVVPLASRSLAEITALDPKNLTSRSMGFGTAVTRGFVAGRLGNAIFAVVGHEGVVVQAEIKVILHASTPRSVSTWTASALGSDFDAKDERSLVYQWTDPEGVARMDDARARALGGAPTAVDVPAELADAYAHLISRFGGEVGSACGAAGSPTETHRAFVQIDRSDDLGLMRAILRGPSPEGRIYAAKALLRRTAEGTLALTPEDEAAIAVIRDLDVPIRSCAGCAANETQIGAELLLPSKP